MSDSTKADATTSPHAPTINTIKDRSAKAALRASESLGHAILHQEREGGSGCPCATRATPPIVPQRAQLGSIESVPQWCTPCRIGRTVEGVVTGEELQAAICLAQLQQPFLRGKIVQGSPDPLTP
jgi:hypothetical protein